MASFFYVTPEDTGHEGPPTSDGMRCIVFDTWLGDDLVRAHPLVLATAPLKQSLETLEPPTGDTPMIEIDRRSAWVSEVMSPFTEAGCAAGRAATKDELFYSVE